MAKTRHCEDLQIIGFGSLGNRDRFRSMRFPPDIVVDHACFELSLITDEGYRTLEMVRDWKKRFDA